MASRIFQCTYCDHKIRLGASVCGNCRAAAPLINQRRVWIGVLVAMALLLFLLASR